MGEDVASGGEVRSCNSNRPDGGASADCQGFGPKVVFNSVAERTPDGNRHSVLGLVTHVLLICPVAGDLEPLFVLKSMAIFDQDDVWVYLP